MKINTCMLISKKKFTHLKGMDSSHCNVQLDMFNSGEK